MHDTRSRFGWIIAASLLVACGCSSAHAFGSEIVVSIADQELALIKRGRTVERYPISTSKFGNGDGVGTYRTPLGVLYVSGKVGDGLPPGTVIKSRVPTGEVIAPNCGRGIHWRARQRRCRPCSPDLARMELGCESGVVGRRFGA
jgi:hypothetical protein